MMSGEHDGEPDKTIRLTLTMSAKPPPRKSIEDMTADDFVEEFRERLQPPPTVTVGTVSFFQCAECGHKFTLSDSDGFDKIVRCVECTQVVADNRKH